ncbi:MAG: PucR family transcriptional regulator [Gordonia sp. (in: high G+C Gram-positive bacteria)]
MTVTVADVLALPVVQQGLPHVLCDAGLDRPVRWVHVSDVPDIAGLLSGGELVLTTGAALYRDPVGYLQGLAAVGAVGVVVEDLTPTAASYGDDTSMHDRSADLAAAAEAAGVTLVTLSRQTRFVDVTEQVHRSLVAEQYEEVAFARRAHELFTELNIRRATPAEITASVADLLGAPVVLEDLRHQAVASAGANASAVLVDWERRSRLHSTASDSAVGTEPGDQWATVPVGRGDDEWARLIALHAGSSRERTVMVLERAAQALVMHRMAERGRVDLERQAHTGLIDDVLAGRTSSEPEAIARATALGLRAAIEYQPAAVVAPGWQVHDDPLVEGRRAAQLVDVVARAARAAGHAGLFSVRDGGGVRMVLAVHASGGASRSQALVALGRAIRRDLDRTFGADDAVVGAAQPETSLTAAIGALVQAVHLADVAAAMPSSSRVVFRASDVRIRGLLSLLRDDPRVYRFAESELRDLILDDLTTGGDLLDVLRDYLALAGNKSALAARRHLSRPTLYAKLARIEQLLDVDLSDGESMTSLNVAIIARDVQAAHSRRGG